MARGWSSSLITNNLCKEIMENDIIEKAEKKLEQVQHSNIRTIKESIPRLREIVHMLRSVKGERSLEIQCRSLEMLIFLGLIVGDAEQVFEPIFALRQKVKAHQLEDREGRLAQLLAESLPFLVEIPGFDETDLEEILAEINAKRKQDRETDRMLDAFLLEAYILLGNERKAEALRQELRKSRDLIYEVECESCGPALQTRVYVHLGDIDEALRISEPLFDGRMPQCMRSPRIPASALLDYYLTQDNLEEAHRFAEELEATIDYPIDGGVKLANPLLEYYVRTGDYLEALEWVNFFGKRMLRSPLRIQRRRFFRSADMLVQGLMGEGWTHLEPRDIKFPIPVELSTEGYQLTAVSTFFHQQITPGQAGR